MRERRSIDQASQSRPAPPDALTATKRRPAPAPSKQAHAARQGRPGRWHRLVEGWGGHGKRAGAGGDEGRKSIIVVWWDDDVLLVVVGYGVPDHWTCRPTVPRRRRPPPQHPSPVVLWACVCRAALRRGESRNGNGSMPLAPSSVEGLSLELGRWRAREASPTLGLFVLVFVRACSDALHPTLAISLGLSDPSNRPIP